MLYISTSTAILRTRNTYGNLDLITYCIMLKNKHNNDKDNMDNDNNNSDDNKNINYINNMSITKPNNSIVCNF